MFSTTFPNAAAKSAGLLPPDNKGRVDGVDWELGAPTGATSLTVRDKVWKSRVTGNVIEVSEDLVTWVHVLTLANVDPASLSFSFDLNMRPAVSYRLTTGSAFYLYWYDATIARYDTLTVTATSAFLCYDYPMAADLAGAELLWFYTAAGRCKYRRQSGRFLTESDFGAIPDGRTRITGAGLGRNWRLHIRFGR